MTLKDKSYYKDRSYKR